MRRQGPRLIALGLLAALVAFLRCARTTKIQGASAIRLDDYKAAAPFEVDAQTIAEGEENAFPLPAALTSCG
jgi:hypothetical protein